MTRKADPHHIAACIAAGALARDIQAANAALGRILPQMRRARGSGDPQQEAWVSQVDAEMEVILQGFDGATKKLAVLAAYFEKG